MSKYIEDNGDTGNPCSAASLARDPRWQAEQKMLDRLDELQMTPEEYGVAAQFAVTAIEALRILSQVAGDHHG